MSYFQNRRKEDVCGVSLSLFFLLYFHILLPLLFFSPSLLLHAAQALGIPTLVLLVLTSKERGYSPPQDYVPGIRYCTLCSQGKTERTHHCSKCKKCIKKMDHHCPWIGGCVNGDNLANFIKLVSIVSITSLLYLLLYIPPLSRLRPETTEEVSISFIILTISSVMMFFILVLSVALLVSQLKLLLKNTTYVEYIQASKLDDLGIVYPSNPYDRGVYGNAEEVFGTLKDFFICTTPSPRVFAKAESLNYWPPLKTSRNAMVRTAELGWEI